MTTNEELYLKTRSTLDACKGVRSCFRSITNTDMTKRFAEAFGHKRRWGKELCAFLESLNGINFHGMGVAELYATLYSMRPRGIGQLLVYDIAIQICRENGISEERVYLFGNGPRRAAALLHLPIETIRVKGCVLMYTTIPHVLAAFDSIGHVVPSDLRNSNNGDHYESYLCLWQKNGHTLTKPKGYESGCAHYIIE